METESRLNPLDLSDALVLHGERFRKRARKRTYMKTVVRCAAHTDNKGQKDDACLLRTDGYYRVGRDVYAVHASRAMQAMRRSESVEEAAAALEEQRQRKRHLSQQFVDDDEAQLLQRYADAKCAPLIVDVYDRSLSASASDASGSLLEKDSQSVPVPLRNTEMLRTLYCASSYVCYVLQSLVRPSKTYVGITNDRFARLRRHNGEICGGARATRTARPWRMLAFVDGFGDNKRSALRFEWSMHNPRKRKLRKPWHGADGRLNCALQLLQSENWSNEPLRLWCVRGADGDSCAAAATVPLNCATVSESSAAQTVRLMCATKGAANLAAAAASEMETS